MVLIFQQIQEKHRQMEKKVCYEEWKSTIVEEISFNQFQRCYIGPTLEFIGGF